MIFLNIKDAIFVIKIVNCKKHENKICKHVGWAGWIFGRFWR